MTRFFLIITFLLYCIIAHAQVKVYFNISYNCYKYNFPSDTISTYFELVKNKKGSITSYSNNGEFMLELESKYIEDTLYFRITPFSAVHPQFLYVLPMEKDKNNYSISLCLEECADRTKKKNKRKR